MTGPRFDQVHHDGALVPREYAVLPMTSVALRYGISVFEGVRVYRGEDGGVHPWLLDAHLERLRASCRAMGLDETCADRAPDAVREVLQANGVQDDAYVRIAVSAAGDGGIDDDVASTLTVAVSPSGRKRWLARGERIRLAVSPRWRAPDAVFPSSVKSISSYAGPRLALAEARRAGFDNCVLSTEHGTVSEAPTATVFALRGNKLVTPRLGTDAVLAGVTRAWILGVAGSLGVTAVPDAVTPDQLRSADEVFLAGTGIEFGPVGSVDGQQLPQARPAVVDLLSAEYFGQARGIRPLTPVRWPEPSVRMAQMAGGGDRT